MQKLAAVYQLLKQLLRNAPLHLSKRLNQCALVFVLAFYAFLPVAFDLIQVDFGTVHYFGAIAVDSVLALLLHVL